MIIVCGWCMKMLGEREPLTDQRVSHGICPECQEKLLVASSYSLTTLAEDILLALDKEKEDKATKTTPDT